MTPSPDGRARRAWRLAIDRSLGRRRRGRPADSPLTDDEWVFLADTETDLNGKPTDTAVSKIVHTLLLARRTFNTQRPGAERFVQSLKSQVRDADWNEEAVSDILAVHAVRATEHGFGVKAFRRDVLGDRLLTLDEASQWIRGQAEMDRGGRPAGGHSRTRSVLTLGYATVNSNATHRVVITAGGTLQRLKSIVKRLTGFDPWDEAQATTFVLTDLTPFVEAIRGSVTVSSPLLVRSTITLTITPSCTPREVADYYRRVRNEEFGRMRRLGERHARLAAFAAQAPDDLT